MSENNRNEEFEKFLITITGIEKQKEFDRKVDRLKKSSSATTVWAVLPGLLGFYGIAHFYLNRPLEGLVILLTGLIPSLFLYGGVLIFLPFFGFNPFGSIPIPFEYLTLVSFIAAGCRIAFFIGNIISARYYYSRYEFYIHVKAKKPWDNWGLNSQI